MINLDTSLIAIYSQAFLLVVLLLLFVRDIFFKIRLKKDQEDVRKLAAGLRGRFENLEEEFRELRTEMLRSKTSSDKLDPTVVLDVEALDFEAKSEVEPETEITPEIDTEEVDLEKKTEELEENSNVIELKASSTPSISSGLKKTRSGFFARLKSIIGISQQIDPENISALEELMIESDLGVKTTQELCEKLKSEFTSAKQMSEEEFVKFLKSEVISIFGTPEIKEFAEPRIILMVGVNGVGKTTSSAKLAKLFQSQGSKVLLAAADTFRAAAVEQLKMWGERLNVPVVAGLDNAKPQTVVFDALSKAQAEGYNCLIIDTAGRLHNKSNLMQELEGVNNVIKRFKESGADEVILVVDGNSGQNAVSQAVEFNEACPLTGIIVTKLDGTPKGGVVVAIKKELGVPVQYIGVGEGAEDLKIFDAVEFTNSLFDSSDVDLAQESLNAATRRKRREAGC